MKILIIITLYLISGPPVGYSEVTGYSGGRVIIFSGLQWDLSNTKYINSLREHRFEHIINTSVSSESNKIYTGRFMLYRNQRGFLRVLITNLKVQDTGLYIIGVGNHTYQVTLDVRTNDYYREPKRLTAYQGQNVSITCNYPLEFREFKKLVCKEDSDNLPEDIHDIILKSPNNRFSISYKSDASLSINISDVREADGGLYLCGVINKDQPVQYYSFFTETRLIITGTDRKTPSPVAVLSDRNRTSPTAEVPSDSFNRTTPSSKSPGVLSDSPSAITIVCVCVALLLFGGFALIICILIFKTNQVTGSVCSSKRNLIDGKEAPTVYENDLSNCSSYENLNIIKRGNNQNPDSFMSQSDSTYQRLDPLTNQSDSGYTSLTDITNQSQSRYQSLDPRTQTNSIYYTLQF